MENQPIIVTRAKSQPMSAFGTSVDVLLTGEQTNGQYTSYRCTVPPNVVPPLHRHDGFDEAFYVLKGEFEVVTENELVKLSAGDSIFIPRGGAHTFRCVGREAGVFLGTATPAGHEHFFYDADELAKSGQMSPESAIELCLRNGIEIVMPATA